MLGTPRLPRYTLTDRIEEALTREIVSGALAPGRELRTSEVAQSLGVSATPVREAVQRLAARGLVEIAINHKARVAEVSIADLKDIYSLRHLLEPTALRSSMANATPDWRRGVQAALTLLRETVPTTADDPPAETRWSEAHRQFHVALLSGGDSPRLTAFIRDLYLHAARYRIPFLGTAIHESTHLEHEEIGEAILAGNVEDAVGKLIEHMRGPVRQLERGATWPPAVAIDGGASSAVLPNDVASTEEAELP